MTSSWVSSSSPWEHHQSERGSGAGGLSRQLPVRWACCCTVCLSPQPRRAGQGRGLAVRGLQMQEYGPPGWPGGSRRQNKARSEADIPTRRSLPAPWLSSQIPAEHRTVSPCQLPPLKDEDKIKRQGSCPEIFFLPSFPRAGENPASLCCGGFQQFHLGFYSKRAKTPWFPYEALLKHLEKFPACNFSLCLYCHRK